MLFFYGFHRLQWITDVYPVIGEYPLWAGTATDIKARIYQPFFTNELQWKLWLALKKHHRCGISVQRTVWPMPAEHLC